MRRGSELAREVRRWFFDVVTYEGERYEIDMEQAEAVVDASFNTIVVARAGSGKTRTLVAKIVYLVAKCGVKPEEIMVFVFNANASDEINERLGKMKVNGEYIMMDVKIASTFHAFSRHIVYDVCDGRAKCKQILAGGKEDFVKMVMAELVRGKRLPQEEFDALAKKMTSFVNRAQQQFLNGDNTLRESIERRFSENDVSEDERGFVELGARVYNRYHRYLLGEKKGFLEYGTDFNLIVSWASRLIRSGGRDVRELLSDKKYILIDEYQDFSQLFLAEVEAIREVASEARLFVVGDDWQAINRFAGSEVKYFKEFEEYFDGARRLEITTNYRCDYLIVDAARKFMKKAMGEKGGFKAESRKAGKVVLVDPKETQFDYLYVEHDERVGAIDRKYKEIVSRLMGRMPKKSTVRYVKTVVEVLKGCRGMKDVMILHRNNETDIEGMSLAKFGEILRECASEFGVMECEEFDARVKVMTMHKSKGLEADAVIILEADEGVIPKMHPDTRLYRVFGETEEVALDDQKRLFYVAMTRAKKQLYIIHEKKDGKVGGFVRCLGMGR